MMKAIIKGNIIDILDCSEGIAFTFYKMIDGKKEIGKIKDLIITNDLEKCLNFCKTELNKARNNSSANSSSYTIDKLEEELDVINEKLNATSQLLNDFKAFSNDFWDENAPEEYQFLERMRFSLFHMCIIELAKLFTDNKIQNFNIFSFLRKVDRFINNNATNSAYETHMVSNMQKRLEEVEIKDLMDNIHYTRDKIFAHTDRDAFKDRVGVELHITQLEKLQNIGYDVIFEIAAKLYNKKLERINLDSGATNVLSLIDKEIKG